jgi:hypothetical protein
MADFFASGRAVDAILVVMTLEAVLLIWWQRRHDQGLAMADVALALLPGVMLLLALRGALVHSSWTWIALCLVLSFVLHLADLRRRRKGDNAASSRRGFV